MTPWVLRLILANVFFYVLGLVGPALPGYLEFSPSTFLLEPWTIITYMFVHGDTFHLLFNMLGLFFFGPRLEFFLGSKRFLLLYFLSGISGALLSVVFSPYASIIGASGGVFGVFFGFAFYWPREQILVWGIIPVEARILVVVMTALSLYGGCSAGGRIAHFAHLGGFIGGYLYLKWLNYQTRSVQTSTEHQQVQTGRTDLERWRRIPRESLHEVNRAELDRILHKIDESGLESLLASEREFLDRFSNNS
jgi:membrane associated rhomboid family serine protease